jgi:hypothetical protein
METDADDRFKILQDCINLTAQIDGILSHQVYRYSVDT